MNEFSIVLNDNLASFIEKLNTTTKTSIAVYQSTKNPHVYLFHWLPNKEAGRLLGFRRIVWQKFIKDNQSKSFNVNRKINVHYSKVDAIKEPTLILRTDMSKIARVSSHLLSNMCLLAQLKGEDFKNEKAKKKRLRDLEGYLHTCFNSYNSNILLELLGHELARDYIKEATAIVAHAYLKKPLLKILIDTIEPFVDRELIEVVLSQGAKYFEMPEHRAGLIALIKSLDPEIRKCVEDFLDKNYTVKVPEVLTHYSAQLVRVSAVDIMQKYPMVLKDKIDKKNYIPILNNILSNFVKKVKILGLDMKECAVVKIQDNVSIMYQGSECEERVKKYLNNFIDEIFKYLIHQEKCSDISKYSANLSDIYDKLAEKIVLNQELMSGNAKAKAIKL